MNWIIPKSTFVSGDEAKNYSSVSSEDRFRDGLKVLWLLFSHCAKHCGNIALVTLSDVEVF